MEEYKHYTRPQGEGLKLHLGCGDYWFSGYINIDHAVLAGTDMVWDLKTKLPFQDQTVKIIESYEFVEHFTKAEIDVMLEDWKRVLIERGTIIVVVPDIEELMKQGLVDQIYGIEQDHKWGYDLTTLRELFESHGFKDVLVLKKEFEHRKGEPKVELICQK